MFQYYSSTRNRRTFYFKGLTLKPQRTYRFSMLVLGGAVKVYISARGIPQGNRLYIAGPYAEWTPFSFEFTTGDSPELAEFAKWGISFIKDNRPPCDSSTEDTYVDNVTLTAVDEPTESIIVGGDFEESRRSAVYEKNWNDEFFSTAGRTAVCDIVTDPLCPTNRCLLLTRVNPEFSTHHAPVRVWNFSRFTDSDTAIPCRHLANENMCFFLMVKRGCVHLTADNAHLTAGTGDLLYCPPSITVSYMLDGGENTAYYRLIITGEESEQLCKKLQLSTLQVIPVQNIAALTEYVDTMASVSPRLHLHTVAVDGLLMQWFAALEAQLFSEAISTKHVDALENAAAQLREHPELALSNDELAAMCGISKTHFINLFKQHTGASPNQYRLRYLIRKACSLLTETEMTVQEIAYSLNVDDPQYFSRLFRSLQGISPRDYRNRHR
ncbi:MAG: helix-turn-helix transcriptional regulator [Clostridia bacterium]|nr:helix-turn-helix transcriptional regulator [Clostridia bacterium]